MSSLAGQTVSHYQIFERIGSGGMGLVYKARDLKLHRFVALKFLPPETTRDPDSKQRFVQEARAASALQHRNICVIHDIDQTPDEQIFISMEYYDGETLDKRITRGPLPIQEALDIAGQVAEGLLRAHEAGMVHRDIKPANIMLTFTGEVKILDFGLAKLAGWKKITASGVTLGTLSYMSPEQVLGKEVDHRSDIWSLGAMLYEMATGQLPFRGDYQNAVVYLILQNPPEPMTKLRSGIPMELERIAEKALEKDPAERYQKADEFLTDVRRLRESIASDSPGSEPRSLPKERSSFWRQPLGLFSSLGVLALFAVAVFWLFGSGGRETGRELRERSIAVLPFTSITRSEDDEIFAEGIHDDILSDLAKIRDLKVLGRQSVRQYRDTDLRPRQIAEELGVTYLLEASVRRVADSVRFVAQLVDGETEENVWAGTYDRKYGAVFSIQSEVAQQVAHEIQATLTPEEKEEIERIPTENLKAYEYYLKGNHYWSNYSTKAARATAAKMYNEATNLDPSFALAHARLSIVYSEMFISELPRRYLDSARLSLERAEVIAPNLSETHTARGLFYTASDMDLDRALVEYEKALDVEPSSAEALLRIGHIWVFRRSFEKSNAYYERAYELDPRAMKTIDALAFLRQMERKWAGAEKLYSKAIAIAPEEESGHIRKAEIYLSGYGDPDGARSILEEALQLVPNPSWRLASARWKVEIYSRNYERALSFVENQPDRRLLRALTFHFMGRTEDARASFDSVRVGAEERIRQWPNTTKDYWYLGMAQAALGMKADAIRNGKYRVENPAIDNYWREHSLLSLAKIYVLAGEHEKAIEELEHLLPIPCRLTKWDLRLDPLYDPLRDHPRFRRLVAD